MAELPSDEENELNFSDYDANSDSDDDSRPRPTTSAVIAHKEMKTVQISDPEEDSDKDESDREDSDKEECNQELEFETISPPAERSDDEEERNKNVNEPKISSTVLSKHEPEKQTFEPISPVSDHGGNFETISPPASPPPSTADKQPQFENISEDEDEEEIKKPEELPEGKFSPVQESDNELNFHDESSNDSGYQIIQKPHVEEPAKTEEKGEEKGSELPDDADDDDIEAPMPSPFSDIGDLDDITESDGQIISDILKDTDATEKQFEFNNEIYNEKGFPPDGELGDGATVKRVVEQTDDKSGPSKEKEGSPHVNNEEHVSKEVDKTVSDEKDNDEHKVEFEKAKLTEHEDKKVEEKEIEAKEVKEKDIEAKEVKEKDIEAKEVEEKEVTEKEVAEKDVGIDERKDGDESKGPEEKGSEKEDSEKEVLENNVEQIAVEKEDVEGGETEKAKDTDKKDEEKKDEEEEEGEDAGDLIADIFGESDEEEEFEGFADEEMPERDDKEASDDEVQTTKVVPSAEEEKKDDSSDDEPRMPVRDFVNDFDVMLEKKRAEKRMKRTRKDVDIISDNDEIIASMIRKMKEAAEEDRMLNQSGKAATKKLKMLANVIKSLRKSDLQMTFIDCGVLSGMKEWLSPLPDHALPHIHIRKLLLQVLLEFPPLEKSSLKSSGIGRAVMLLFKHPKETRENKHMAGKIISNWARPIFNVSTNYLDMSKEEREERDKKTLTHNKRREESEESLEPKRTKLDKEEEDMENRPRKPGDPGWCYRARVPQASNRDYVNRPVSKLDAYEQTRALNTKKPMNRYEKHALKMKGKRALKAKAADISVSGSKMGL